MKYLFAAVIFSLVFISCYSQPRTIGNGEASILLCSNSSEHVLFDEKLDGNWYYGIMTHFWITGGSWSKQVIGNNAIDDGVIVEYYVDDDEQGKPSISFTPAMMAGQGFPNSQVEMFPPGGLFEAAGKMGKASTQGGWYNNFEIPFYTKIQVKLRLSQAEASTGCLVLYSLVRGYKQGIYTDPEHPIAQDGMLFYNQQPLQNYLHNKLNSGVGQLQTPRLKTFAVDDTFSPLSFVPVLKIDEGYSAQVYLTTFAIKTKAQGIGNSSYMEGCWHLYQDQKDSFPGVILGTGLEDFFDSGYGFSVNDHFPLGVRWSHATSGFTHFNATDSVETLSAYKFFDSEVVGMLNGGTLEWRVGDVKGKCKDKNENNVIGWPQISHVRTLTWYYVWPYDQNQQVM